MEQRGTGDAVRAAAGSFEGFEGDVLILYGDVPGLVALCAPRPVWLADAATNGAAATLASAAYKSAGVADKLSLYHGDAKSAVDAAASWLIG